MSVGEFVESMCFKIRFLQLLTSLWETDSLQQLQVVLGPKVQAVCLELWHLVIIHLLLGVG